VTTDITDGNERTPLGKITSTLTVAQHLRAVFDSQEWMSVHMDMKINQVVVMYLDIEEILRPVSPPVVSVCKGILTAYSFLFLGTPRHYAMRKYSCWCRACSRVRGRGPGNGTVSRGTHLDGPNCGHNKLTVWREDHFTMTKATGIEKRKKGVAGLIAKELTKAKLGAWGCVQTREMWTSRYTCVQVITVFFNSVMEARVQTVRNSSRCHSGGLGWFTRVHASTMEIALSGSRGGFTK